MPRKNNLRLTRRQFNQVMLKMRVHGKCYAGARIALVQNLSVTESAKIAGITQQAVSEAIGKIRKHLDKRHRICPMCGNKMQKNDEV